MPPKKPEGVREPKKNPTKPPRNVDKVPTYGPKIIPITGAIIVAAVIWLGIPII
jgi:hypothetical protein